MLTQTVCFTLMHGNFNRWMNIAVSRLSITNSLHELFLFAPGQICVYFENEFKINEGRCLGAYTVAINITPVALLSCLIRRKQLLDENWNLIFRY